MALFTSNLQERDPQFSREVAPPSYPAIEPGYLPPNAKVHFHFAPHVLEEHFEGAAQILQETPVDIFMPELSEWKPHQLNALRGMARRQSKARQSFRRIIRGSPDEKYHAALGESIFGRWVEVRIIDNKPGEIDDLPAYFDKEAADIDEALNLVADFEAAQIETWGYSRDKIMITNLGREVTKIVDAKKHLKKKEEVSVLCTLGSNHLPIFDYLSKEPAAKDKVGASLWIGGERMDEADVLHEIYRQGGIPTRKQLLDGLAYYSLSRIALPHLLDLEPVLPQGAKTTRKPRYRDLVGIVALERIKRDMKKPKNHSLLLDIFNANFEGKAWGFLLKHITRAEDYLGKMSR